MLTLSGDIQKQETSKSLNSEEIISNLLALHDVYHPQVLSMYMFAAGVALLTEL